jgi:hypothetical protein
MGRFPIRTMKTPRFVLLFIASAGLAAHAHAAQSPRPAEKTRPPTGEVFADWPSVPELSEVRTAAAIPLVSLGNPALAARGLVDVTSEPFNADATGRNDVTAVLQQAIFFAREHQMVVFFPTGTYRVSATLRCPHGNHDPAGGRGRSRDFACVLVGSRAGPARPKIVLAPHSPGYGDSTQPRHVVQFWSWEGKEGASGPLPHHQDNINMNQMLVGIDIAIGEGNPGAVGIRCRAAQGTSVQDCTIDATHGYAGLDGGAGSGGGHHNVTVLGGQIGADLRECQPAPTITGFVLLGQTKHAILYDGRQTLTAVGCRIEFAGRGPAVVVGGARPMLPNGQVSMVDSSIAFTTPGPNVAFAGTSSLYLNNVFICGAQLLADWGSERTVRLPGDGWTWIHEYAHGRENIAYSGKSAQGKRSFTYTSTAYVDGKSQTGNVLEQTPGAPPEDLTSRHIWDGTFPSWERTGTVSVKDAPYRAAGDGKTDDHAAIQRAIDEHEMVFLPKGNYLVSRTLRLKPNTKLLGLHLCFATIEATRGGDFDDAAQPRPIVATADDPEARTVLAFLGISTGRTIAGAYALDWRAGRHSIYRSVNIEFPRWRNQGHPLNAPLVIIAGNGGGRWYNFFQESWNGQGPDYRHLLVTGTREPLGIYQCNPEHTRSDANLEIRNARFVSLYGVKGEYNQPIISVRDSDHIRIFGYGGNAAALPGRALFTIRNTPNFLAANLIDSPRFAGNGAPDAFAGAGVDPDLWHMLRDDPGTGPAFLSPPLDRPVLVRRGSPRGR